MIRVFCAEGVKFIEKYGINNSLVCPQFYEPEESSRMGERFRGGRVVLMYVVGGHRL